MKQSPSAPPPGATDVFASLVFLALVAPVMSRGASGVTGPGDAPWALAAMFLGVLAADLTSGVVHWMCDTFFCEDTPVLGRAVIQPFREHHRDPLAMTRRGFLRIARSSMLIMSAGLAVDACVRAPLPGTVFIDVWWATYACAVLVTNQFHCWAHTARVPRPVRWLQRARLILSPAHHARHHEARDGRAFCVTTGWLNPLLDGLGVFARPGGSTT